MMSSWKTHSCYAEDFNVNGTICSFLIYLSEVISISVLCTYTAALENLTCIDTITTVIYVLLLGSPLFKSWPNLMHRYSTSITCMLCIINHTEA